MSNCKFMNCVCQPIDTNDIADGWKLGDRDIKAIQDRLDNRVVITRVPVLPASAMEPPPNVNKEGAATIATKTHVMVSGEDDHVVNLAIALIGYRLGLAQRAY